MHRERYVMKCLFQQCFVKIRQHLIILVVGCGHKSKTSIAFPVEEDGLYNIPNVYLDSKLYFHQGFLEKEDAIRENANNTRREKDLSATGELLDYLKSDPAIWKRIKCPNGEIRHL